MEKTTDSHCSNFVSRLLAINAKNKGFAAQMSRADNPDTEYMALGALCSLGIDIQNDALRLPHAVIGAALSRGRIKNDGNLTLGHALYYCQEKNADFEKTGSARLRRLLACSTLAEACLVIRRFLALIQSKKTIAVSYASVLSDLLAFNKSYLRQDIKRRWASDFFNYQPKQEEE